MGLFHPSHERYGPYFYSNWIQSSTLKVEWSDSEVQGPRGFDQRILENTTGIIYLDVPGS